MTQIDVVLDPHTAIFTGPTSCGKTQRVLDLLEHEYKNCFQNIVILCPTIQWNSTYLDRSLLWKDDYIFLINPKDQLFEWIDQFFKLLAGEDTLFIIDDIIADENLDKKRQSLLELAISGRHRNHSLWLLTQSYTALPKNLRRYPHERSDMKLINEETNIISDSNWEEIKTQLKKSKHACLYIRLDHPRSYKILDREA